jgi:hypothetical protein
MFNLFLGSDVDVCFDGLSFERDMLPCIKFVTFLSQVFNERARPLIKYAKKSIEL